MSRPLAIPACRAGKLTGGPSTGSLPRLAWVNLEPPQNSLPAVAAVYDRRDFAATTTFPGAHRAPLQGGGRELKWSKIANFRGSWLKMLIFGTVRPPYLLDYASYLLGSVAKPLGSVPYLLGFVTKPLGSAPSLLGSVAKPLDSVSSLLGSVAKPFGSVTELLGSAPEALGSVTDSVDSRTDLLASNAESLDSQAAFHAAGPASNQNPAKPIQSTPAAFKKSTKSVVFSKISELFFAALTRYLRVF